MKYFLFLVSFLSFANSYSQCDAPINLASNSTINGGLNEVDLSWDAVTGASLYAVYYRVFGSGDSYTTKSTNINNVTITGLPSTTTYEWKVRTVCQPDWSVISDYSISDSFTTSSGGSCTVPANFQSISTGSGSNINSTDLSWDAVGAAVLYSVAYRIQGDPSFTFKTVNTNALTLDGLPASTNYEYKVRTICASDWSVVSDFSAVQNFVSGTGIECSAPTGVNIASNDATSFTIAWNTVNSAIQYYIQYRIVGEQEWANAEYRYTLRPSDKTITGLVSDKAYEARMLSICATDGGGKWTSYSSYSSIVTFDTYQCNMPGTLSSTPGSTSATLNWGAVSGVLFYQIKYRKTGTSSYLNEVQPGAGQTSTIITNLDPNTGYDWIIRSRCDVSSSGFNSAYSAVQTFTTTNGSACAIPGGLSSTPTSNSTTLNWNAVSGAIDYQIKYKLNGTSSYLNSVIVNAPAVSTVISNLSSSTQYDWIIRTRCTVDGSNDSDYSTVQSFTTKAGTSCDTPTGLSSTPTGTSALLSWNAEPSSTQYRLKYRVQGSGPFLNSVFITAPTSSTNVSGLTVNTTYEWLVRTECTGGNSAYTSIQTFTTLSSIPAGVAITETAKIQSFEENNVLGSLSSDNSELLAQKKVDEKSALNKVVQTEILIYPNPTQGLINFGITEYTEVSMYNSKGELIIKTVFGDNGIHNLDLQNYEKGIYYFILEGEDFRRVERILLK